MERAIHVSSIKRERIGGIKSDDFLIKFNPPLYLDPHHEHRLAVDRLSMTYSWYNIRNERNNNTIKYSHDRGANWNTITFKDGMYSYSDINDYIHQYLLQKNHQTTDAQGNKKFGIDITFILSTFRVLITFNDDKYRLDLRQSNLGELIGFEDKLVAKNGIWNKTAKYHKLN